MPHDMHNEHYAHGWGRTRLVQEIDWLREQYERATATLAEVSAERDRLRGAVERAEKAETETALVAEEGRQAIYTISARKPWSDTATNTGGTILTFHRAVVTLEEAQQTAVIAVHRRDERLSAMEAAEMMNEADDLPEEGGTVGPLPDGTMIEVAPMDVPAVVTELFSDADVERGWPTDREICVAYNAARGVA